MTREEKGEERSEGSLSGELDARRERFETEVEERRKASTMLIEREERGKREEMRVRGEQAGGRGGRKEEGGREVGGGGRRSKVARGGRAEVRRRSSDEDRSRKEEDEVRRWLIMRGQRRSDWTHEEEAREREGERRWKLR